MFCNGKNGEKSPSIAEKTLLLPIVCAKKPNPNRSALRQAQGPCFISRFAVLKSRVKQQLNN